MYEAFFGLKTRPFPTVPRLDLYYAGAAIEGARQNLLRCVQRGEGPAVIIGPSGTGKTLLCQLLAAQLRSDFRVALLLRGRMNSRRALLQAILYELQQPYRDMDEGELRLALTAHVSSSEQCPQGAALIVDEAHCLPLRLLDELRTLTNVAADGQPRVRLVLAGGATLEERLASPKLDSFSQRVAARCYLEALNRDETLNYIHSQLGTAGGNAAELFPAEACYTVHRATDGVPRLINQVCDHALLLACAAGRKPIDAGCVEEAWGDLQQLPTPWNGESPAKQPGRAVIEFGGLEDDEEQAPGAAAAALPTVPMLRISRQEDEVGPEPLEQLQRIEQGLSQLEDDFQPAGSIGPEVELVFTDPGNPFSEPFAQEEVVSQRVAPVPPAETAALPAAAPPPRAPQSEAVRVETPPVAVASPPQQTLAAADTHGSVLLRRDAMAAPVDDHDMIVVEENYEELPSTAVRSVTPIRHSEYRRLFATLRHG